MRLQRNGSVFFAQAVFTAAMWLVVCLCTLAYGEEKKKELPERSIAVSPEYTGVIVQEGEDVSIDLTVADRGRRDENVDLRITSIPKGWKAPSPK